MAKATAPTPQRTSAAKKASSTTTAGSRSRKSPASLPPPSAEPSPDPLLLLTQRLDTLEEKVTTELSTVLAEVRALTTAAGSTRSGDSAPSDTFLPVVADLIRRSLTEHVAPVVAALKRLEERMGFISNRLKHPAGGGGGGPERQKQWRHDQQRHSRPRLHPAPRSGQGQGQPWTPPSAASVQGHFAPRPPFGGEDRQPRQEEDE